MPSPFDQFDERNPFDRFDKTEVRAAPESSAWARVPAQIGSNLLTGAEGTLVGIPGLIGEAVAPELGHTLFPGEGGGWPTPSRLNAAFGKLGLANQAWMAPQNAAERYGIAAAAGAGAALPLAPLGPGATAIGRAGGAALSGGLGGVAEEAGGPLLGAAAGVAGGLGVNRATDAFARHALSRELSTLGTSRSSAGAADAIGSLADGWATMAAPGQRGAPSTFARQLSDFQAPVDSLVGAKTPVQLTNLQEALESVANSAGPLSGMVGQVQPTAARALLRDPSMMQWAANGKPVDWQYVRKLQNSLANKSDDPEFRFYLDALNKDMMGAAQQHSPAAQHAFLSAEESAADLLHFRNSTLPKMQQPGVVLSPDEILQAQQYMPKATREYAAGLLHDNPGAFRDWPPEVQDAVLGNPKLSELLRKLQGGSPPGDVRTAAAVGTQHGVESTVLGHGGHALGTMLGYATGLPHQLVGAAGEMGGLALPAIWRRMKAVASNPNRLIPPIEGVFGAGSNALFPQDYSGR